MARVAHYDVNDYWTPQATFTVAGTPTDPTTLIVKVMDPTGTVTTITEATPAGLSPAATPLGRIWAGVYRLTQALDDAGHWEAYFQGTGAAAAAEHHEAIVDPSPFYESGQIGTRALVTLREAKDWLNQNSISTAEDLELARVVNDISDRFHQEARREFKVNGTNPQTRVFPIDSTDSVAPRYIDGVYMGDFSPSNRRVSVGDMMAAPTAVSIIDRDWMTVLESVAPGTSTRCGTGATRQGPIRWLEFQSDVTSLGVGMRVSVTGAWGFPSVPGNVRQAVLDGVVAVLDRKVETYSTDLFPTSRRRRGVLIATMRPMFLSLPPRSWRWPAPTATFRLAKLVKLTSNFRAGHRSAADDVVALADQEGTEAMEAEAAKRISRAADQRGYDTHDRRPLYVLHAPQGLLSHAQWWWRFFEFGTTYIRPVPALGPGHRKGRKAVKDTLQDDFEKWVRRKAGMR